MVNIRDVAKTAGVSVATVSRVINKNPNVSINTQTRVEKVIKQLGYKPNVIARSLSSRKTFVVALVVPSISNPFFPEVARAVEDIAYKEGYKVFLCNTDDKEDRLKDYLKSFIEHYVDGVIIDSQNITKNQVYDLKERGISVVLIDRIEKNDMNEFTTVYVDNRKGGQLATEHLLEVGCNYIGHIRGPEDIETANQRFWGYKDKVSGLSWYDQSWVGQGDYSVNSGFQVAKELFMKHKNIDGIFAANDLMAIGALRAAYEWGKVVPDELSIIGFDGISMSSLTVPRISTIQQPIYNIGKLAMKELIRLMTEEEVLPQTHELDLFLQKRESTMRPLDMRK